MDLNKIKLRAYVDYRVGNVIKIKGKFGFRVTVIFDDMEEKESQHSGFAKKEEAEKERDMIAGCISKGMDLEQIFEEHKKACWSKEREAEQPYRAYEMNTKIIIKRMMKEAGLNTEPEK